MECPNLYTQVSTALELEAFKNWMDQNQHPTSLEPASLVLSQTRFFTSLKIYKYSKQKTIQLLDLIKWNKNGIRETLKAVSSALEPELPGQARVGLKQALSCPYPNQYCQVQFWELKFVGSIKELVLCYWFMIWLYQVAIYEIPVSAIFINYCNHSYGS